MSQEQLPIHAAGFNGQVTFDGQFVTIHRKGFRARATVGKGEKRIPVQSIVAVQWKPAGPMVNGFIQFTVPGGNERRSAFGRQTADAVQDENSVVFTRGQRDGFEALRQAVEAAVAHRGAPIVQSVPQASAADELAKLAELHRAGALTDQEFAAMKARITGFQI